MEKIKVISKDNKLRIIINEGLTNGECLMLIKEKLEKIFIYSIIKKEIILELGKINFTNKEILQLFDIFDTLENYIISKIICNKKFKEEIIIAKGNIRNGEVKIFDKSVLFVGTINSGGKIICDGNLYVLGRVNGDVELKDKSALFYCENIYNSLVKIGNKYRIFTEDLYDRYICLKNDEIQSYDYKIGEKIHGKSNSCYIW